MVHHDIEAAPQFDGVLYSGARVRRVGRIGHKALYGGIGCGHFLECRRPSARYQNVGAFASEHLGGGAADPVTAAGDEDDLIFHVRSEEHTSELQSLMRISYAVLCLKKKNKQNAHSVILTSITIHLHTNII